MINIIIAIINNPGKVILWMIIALFAANMYQIFSPGNRHTVHCDSSGECPE